MAGRRLPESPIYCRPDGYHTINRRNCSSKDIWNLLNKLRELSNAFCHEHHIIATEDNLHDPSAIAGFRDEIFALRPGEDIEAFASMHDRYTYEALRLTALVYSHALATRTPLSRTGDLIIVGTASSSTGQWPAGISAMESLHVQIRNAILKTDCSDCWGPLAGVLFWISLVAGAAANPGPLANEERVSEDEDGRKFLAAIAVRSSILLSFEFGGVMLESLRRLVGIEDVLAKGQMEEGEGRDEWWVSEPGFGSLWDGGVVVGPEQPGVEHDGWAQFGDFARDFDGLS